MASARAELDALRAEAELAAREHNVDLAKVRELWWEEVEVWKATTSWSEAALAKVRDETSAEVKRLRFERDIASARHHELLASICDNLKACEERKDNMAGALVKLRKNYEEGRKVTTEAHVAQWGDLRERRRL